MGAPPRRPRPPARRVRLRRAAALLALLVLAGLAALAAADLFRGREGTPAPRPTFRIVFPEGFTRAQMAARVGAEARAMRASGERLALTERAYVAASERARVPCLGSAVRPNLEGFLFPATYDVDPSTTGTELVAAQVRAFCRGWGSVDLAYARAKRLTPYDVLEIASMIEREVRAPEERPLVAAVVYNRLRAGMPLGLDATLRYGLHIPAARPITAAQLADPTPYNTRVHAGLPPTPIANPGLASIVAAAHPAKVDYLYFVRRPGSDRQFFTASADAFYAYECAHGYGC